VVVTAAVVVDYLADPKSRERETRRRWARKNRERRNEAHRLWYAKNREKQQVKYRLKYAENREKDNERCKRWREANPQKAKESYRKGNLKKSYGLTLDQYKQMLQEHGGVCAICKQPNSNGKRLSVDHDHRCCEGKESCGKCVRGLLCDSCNKGIGILRDSPIVLFAAIEYIMKHAEQGE